MAVVNTKATAITNADGNALVLNDKRIERGFESNFVGTVEVAAADDNNSVYRFCRVHSSWRVDRIVLYNDAITGGTAYDCGLYDTAANGGLVVTSQQQLFAGAVDLSSASASAGVDITYNKTITNISQIEKKLWELMGLSSDPVKFYDVALTGTTVGSGAGTISMRVVCIMP